MEKKTIWKSNKKKPKPFKKIIFCTPCNTFCGQYDAWSDFFVDDDTLAEYGRAVVNKWAYISDVIGATKALDVAIDALNVISANAIWDSVDTSEHAEKAIKNIRKIMKGC